MNKISLKKKAYFKVLKFSTAYSLALILAIISIAYLNYRAAHLSTVEKELKSLTNSFSSTVLSVNFPAFIKVIQQKTNLQEIVIFDSNCSILASTTLANIQNCEVESSVFQRKELSLNSKPIIIFYKLGLTPFSFLKGNYLYSFALYFIIFLITTITLFSFLNLSFLKPLETIKASIHKDQIPLPLEFDFIGSKILELKNTIEKIEKERIYFNIARRVVHDIRNPLLFLKLKSKANKITNLEVIDKIEEIEFHITSLLSTSRKEVVPIDLNIFFQNLKNELEELFDLNIHIKCLDISEVSIQMHPYDLKNIFQNLARNSFEAKANRIELNCTSINRMLSISFYDDGVGIPPQEINKLFKANYTTKENGNGIGLKSIADFLLSLGGSIKHQDRPGNGTCFEINLPICSEEISNKDIVLIDNDKFIHIAWKSLAEKKGKNLYSFFSVKDFLLEFKASNFDIPIFIDSDLGDNEPGEVSAKKVFDKGFQKIYLATSFTDINLEEYPWIIASVSKTNPF